jgi:hypothetical protein
MFLEILVGSRNRWNPLRGPMEGRPGSLVTGGECRSSHVAAEQVQRIRAVVQARSGVRWKSNCELRQAPVQT